MQELIVEQLPPKIFNVELFKISTNRLNDTKVQRHLKQVAAVAEGIFKVSLKEINDSSPINENDEIKFRTSAIIQLTKEKYSNETVVNRQFYQTFKHLKKKAEKFGWELNHDILKEFAVPPEIEEETDEGEPKTRPSYSYTDFYLPEFDEEVRNTYFDGIYEREPHINIILDALKTGHATNWESRSHILLYGDPASAKSSVLLAFKDWINNCNEDAVMSIDMPQATKAGCTAMIMERLDIFPPPRVIILEEIEKISLESLSFLLSLMDLRGQINKFTFRQRETKEAKILIMATCNDTENLKKVHGGAVWSRFMFKLYCPRPSESLTHRILLREVNKMGGNPKWADEAYELAKELDIKDIRQIIAMLAGGDRLLNNDFQRDYISTFFSQPKP